MKPVTRRTLFRIVLAIHLFDAGLVVAARYALPRKYTLRYYNPYVFWLINKCLMPMALKTLRRSFVTAQMINRDYDAPFSSKIGDTISVRKPSRYVGVA